MIILKSQKKQGFTLSLENALIEKPQRGGGHIDTALNLFRIKTDYDPPLTLLHQLLLHLSPTQLFQHIGLFERYDIHQYYLHNMPKYQF